MDTSNPLASPPAGDTLAASFAASYAGVVAFIAVVDEGSFAKAADRLGIGRSAVSRSVQKLEAQLDARLFHRTTRSTALTREGELFHANCRVGVDHIQQALDDMRELRQGPPRGPLRIVSTVGFGRKVVAPLLRGFQARYPEIALDLRLDDRPADFTADGIDVAFRDGRLDDSQVIAKRLIPMRLAVVASPGYAREHGLPRSVDELAAHRCINLRLASRRVRDWEFKVDGQPRKLVPPSQHTFNDADLVLQAALDGQGLAQVAAYQAGELLRSGQLVTCLEDQAPDDGGHYLCYLSRRQLPARIRVFIDHMSTEMRALDFDCPLAATALS
ncbi:MULTISPECIES: LysR family transcriptional regulator [unclassified Rhizobacter]|uniref:LysR family transcriptional regulator n=1 Tax=unclassified Rhizobacter TaxID=2640088 RepID=UPI0006F2DF99|nr:MULTISPECIES: LysR family transcriptional regulator [unclassified Rhizobacter]KQU67159.1 LysR family transcriptional regulator [Rhizobacter sp. Root29]KQV98130.1 LysR family transcriptional regulator [Rhizobacter sp. Root1238]KRB02028.1 LysR family transcriptional regulator [Rhizobacter sp. Root16D2]